MGPKSKMVANGLGLASLERRKKDKTVHVLDGLVADLARRTQAGMDGRSVDFHLESIRGIHRLLLQIQKLERPFVSQRPLPDVTARLKLLQDWLELQGVEIDGIKLEGGLPQGAGVMASKRFERGEIISVVPATAMMTTATAIRSKEDVGLLYRADPIIRQMPTLILILHLLFEKHRAVEDPSKWAGYIASLPGQAEGKAEGTDGFIMPLTFSMETIEALRGTAALIEMHKALRNYARQYAHIRSLLRQLREHSPPINQACAWFTWTEFRWAASVVMTRQNPIPGTPDMEMGQALALIPLLDMFNHEEGEITCHFDVTQQHMELTAKRQFQADEQVFISYGNRPNSALLLYSGFVPDHNSKDRIKVPVELSHSDPLQHKKVALLKWLELPASGWLELYHDGTPSPELATWIKVAAMDDLAVVTENLRAAIASRTQQTAAFLQYKAALREAEEKAQANGQGIQPQSIRDSKDDVGEKDEETSTGTLDNTIENRDIPTTPHMETLPVTEMAAAVPSPELEGNSENQDRVELEEVSGAAFTQTPSAAPPEEAPEGGSETGEHQSGVPSNQMNGEVSSELQESYERVLGELLFPAEAALLAEICRARIADFQIDFDKSNGLSNADFPQGLKLGLGEDPQGKNTRTPIKKELAMALKLWRQERATLMKAIDRATTMHCSDENCQHC